MTSVTQSFPGTRLRRPRASAWSRALVAETRLAPADLISWLGASASVCTLSKPMVHFQRARGTVELTHVDIRGCRAETFCLRANRHELLTDSLGMIPGPRLPDMDYGSWLQGRVVPPLPLPAAAIAHEYDARIAEPRLRLSRCA